MKNKYILDFNLLEENNISLDEYTLLIYLYENKDVNIEEVKSKLYSLQDKLFIKIIREEHRKIKDIILRYNGKFLIESCIYKGPVLDKKLRDFADKYLLDKPEESSFDEFVKEYRSLFKGLKVGSQGNFQSVKDKLLKWMKLNPSYTHEDILRATRTYINSLDNFKYLQQADYFIYKKDKFGEQSRLSAFIDEDEAVEDGWGSQLS